VTDKRQFPNSILERKDVAVWGRREPDSLDSPVRFDAGVIANISSDCVGLSNLFGQNAYPAAATLCAGMAPSLPLWAMSMVVILVMLWTQASSRPGNYGYGQVAISQL